MNRALIAVLLALLLILGALLWFFLPELLNIDRSGWSSTEYGACYLDADGNPVSGWYEIEGETWYFTPECYTPHTGWASRNGSCCYTVDGQPVAGWMELDGARYYFDPNGTLHTGWLEEDGNRYYLESDGTVASGWTDTDLGALWVDESGMFRTGVVCTDKGLYCFADDGSMRSGWVEQDGKRYYFQTDGSAYTGWLTESGKQYYLTSEGFAATGRLEIDGEVHYFSSTGMEFILVNRWNPLPEEYKPAYVYVEGHAVDPECKEALMQMLADCRAAGNQVHIMSAYRSYRDQAFNYNNAVWARVRKGLPYEEVKVIAAMNVALPGTSEHQLGLAVDLVDSSCPELEEIQETLPAQQWLMEHCWDYGFILRYPNGTTEYTGIVYEPWHYRYVGVEIALDVKESGLCLEAYIDCLTNDGTICGDPSSLLEKGGIS